jgi:pyruvate dehydrogenase E2 component (dihydrolipoamide acetyltransferase)
MLIDVVMPQMGESIFEGTLTRWLKKAGEPVVRDEPLFEISTDKVDSEIPAPASGLLKEIRVPEGETVPVNSIVGIIESISEKHAPPTQETAPAEDQESMVAAQLPPTIPGPHRSSPYVRRIAREESVDLNLLLGTGTGGRITKKDILRHLEYRRILPPAMSGPSPSESPLSAPPSQVEVIPLSVMRRNIAEHMLASRRTSAHVTTIFEVDMTRIARLKEKEQTQFKTRHGVKLTYLPFFLQASAEALKSFPLFNASVDEKNIYYKKDINIGVAVSLDWGLIVPVIKNTDRKTFVELTEAISDLAHRARAKKLKPEEVQGGTFTLTNPGVFGSLIGTPIIHQPQVAILCVGAITKRPMVIEDAIAIRSMVYLSLTFDHRLIDGALADQFMAHFKRKLESWDQLLP